MHHIRSQFTPVITRKSPKISMSISAFPLRLGDRGDTVADLHRTLELLQLPIDQGERDRRVFGPATQAVLRDLQTKCAIAVTGILDGDTRTKLEGMLNDVGPFCVCGRLTDASGQPIAGATIVAMDRQLRRSEVLGQATTDSGGDYEVRYTASRLVNAAQDGVALVVRASLANEAIAESKVVFHAAPEARVDLAAKAVHGPAEFDRLVRELTPRLDGVPLGELTDDDIAFLAGDIGCDRARIAQLMQAHRMASAELPAAAIFGWLTQGLAASADELSRQPLGALQDSLVRASRAGVVSAEIAAKAEACAHAITQPRVRGIVDAASAGSSAHDPWLGQIRNAMGDERFATAFAPALANHGHDEQVLWPKLAEGGLKTDEVALAQHVFELKSISRGHAPLLEAVVQAAKTEPRLRDPRGLAALEPSDWQKLLATPTANGAPVGAPPSVPGKSPEARIANYARILTAEVEAQRPTERFLERTRSDLDNPKRRLSSARRRDWLSFLAANPDFDVRTSRLDALLVDAPARARRLDGVSDHATLVKDLASIQRVFRLVPEPRTIGADRLEGLPLTDRYDAVVTLLENDLHSAVAVLRSPQGAFVAEWAPRLGAPEVAQQVYQRAAYVGDVALLAMMRARALTDEASPAFASTADYPSLFGTSDLCECEHCRSFLGPAAYLVDTLLFLNDAGDGADPFAAWNRLTSRRSDLLQIALTCANANTELPYVDLVNEILEEAVAPSQFVAFALLPSDGFDPVADLSARTVTEGIRAAFRGQPNPIELSSTAVIHFIEIDPFESRYKRWFISDQGRIYGVDAVTEDGSTTVRVYSVGRQTSRSTEELIAAPEHINLSAYDALKQAAYPWSPPLDLGWETTRGLLDGAGLSRHDALLAFAVLGDRPRAVDDACESMPVVCEVLGMSPAEADILLRPLPQTAPPTDGPAVVPVAPLLEQTGLRYAELVELLETRLINPRVGASHKLSIQSVDPGAPMTCDLTRLAIVGLDAPALDNLHRFTRLRRRLGWETWELDVVLSALGAAAITQAVLVAIAYAERLRRALQLPVDVVAAFFGALDTVPHLRMDDEGPRPSPSLYDRLFRSTAGGARPDSSFIEVPAGKIVPELSGALADHAPAIRAALALDAASLGVLTALLPDATLSISNLSILLRHAALARGLGLSSRDLLRLADLFGERPFADGPRSVWRFVTRVARFRTTGLALDELEYLLTAGPEVNERLGRTTAESQRMLEELSRSFREVPGATTFATLATTDPKRVRDAVIQSLASATGIGVLVLEAAAPAWTSLVSGLTADPAPKSLPGDDVLGRLDKLARLLRFTALPDAEAAWLIQNGRALGIADLAGLPITPRPASATPSPLVTPVPWTQFERLLDYLEARAAAKNPRAPLYLAVAPALAPDASFTRVLASLSAATGWSEADLVWLLGRAGRLRRGDAVPAKLRDATTYAQLARAIDCARRLGAPAEKAAAIVGDANMAAADALGQLVRDRRDAASWLAISGQLNDRLRERRRDALVAYLLRARPSGLPASVRTADDLYAHYLVDVEMGACMRTSRIKLAVSSVQTFVQRCLMGLEGPDIRIAPDKAREWTEWRGSYRIWEANRKVFLYPENWVEPELRETRSPFFRELQSELGQAELTAESAERLVEGYLARLEGISNLEPVAIHPERTDSGEILHLLARTTSLPHLHHYRRRTTRITTDGSRVETWSPWDRVEMEIDSDHVILLVFKGRLRLYWAAIRDAPSADTVANTPPKWGVTLFWSEYDGHRWSRRQEVKLDKPIVVTRVDDGPPGERITLRARVMNNAVAIDGYAFVGPFLKANNPVPESELSDGPIDDRHAYTMSGWIVDKFDVPIPNSEIKWTWTWRGERNGHELNDPHEPTSEVVPNGNYSFEVPKSTKAFTSLPDLEISVEASCKTKNGRFSLTKKIDDLVGHQRVSFRFTEVEVERTLVPAQWLPSFAVFIDSSSRGAVVMLQSGDPLVPPPACRITGNGYRGDGISTDGLGLPAIFDIPLNRPFSLIAAACVDTTGAQPDIYAYRDDQAFALLEQREAPAASAILGPMLALVFAGKDLAEIYASDFAPDFLFVGDRLRGWFVNRFFEPSAVEQVYFWEVVFHIPFLIATRFLSMRRFTEARQWLHCIFDPTRAAGAGVARFWVTRPFRKLAASNPDEVRALLPPAGSQELVDEVTAMRDEPFRPHAIAALRIAAYMRATFFRYLDVLVECGDNLFRRETIESLNEATQLYVLARAMLGARPEKVAARALPAPHTYESLQLLDSFARSPLANAEVEIGELLLPDLASLPPPTPSLGSVALFCLPRNTKLDGYRDTVEDRLFKVRHCQDLEGSALRLALWDAPIDPALLVRATAAGLTLQQILDDLSGPPVHFRVTVLVQKANELCSEVRSLGAALLSALEKRDSEKLGRLRAHHEVELLGRVRTVKQTQITEARASREALEKSLETVNARGDHYARLLRGARASLPALGDAGGFEALANTVAAPVMTAGEGTVLLELESQDFAALDAAQEAQDTAANWELAAAIAHPVTVSMPAGVATIQAGLGAAFSAVAARFRADGGQRSAESTHLSKQSGLVLRAHDWALQLRLAERERAQITAQIEAAKIRETIAARELANHEQQIEESREVESFLRDKYTSDQLYDWTIGEVSKLYYASYRLAQGMARRAERACQRELGVASLSIIGNDHWDSFYSGLLAGERLAQDLKRLEVAYLDGYVRRYEITKHVSLAQVAPEKLLQLRETGTCHFVLTRELFDADYPGHDLRRIKAVAVTIPAVTGPHAGVHGKLSLRGSDAIVISHGVNDSGLFEQNLRDERFLPFEGAEVNDSDWTLDLKPNQNAFDLQTITDVVLHLRYTAKEGAASTAGSPAARACLFDLRREFADAWQRWKHDPAAALVVALDRNRFPFTRGAMALRNVTLYARVSPADAPTDLAATFGGDSRVALLADGQYGDLRYGQLTSVATAIGGSLGIDVLAAGAGGSLRGAVEDLYLICQIVDTALPDPRHDGNGGHDGQGRTIALVQIDAPQASLLVGDTVQASSSVKDSSGAIVPVPVAWTTSNAAVATVGPTGLIAAVGPGAATITATAGAVSGVLTMTAAIRPAAILVTPSSYIMADGLSAAFSAVAVDALGHVLPTPTIDWAVADSTAAQFRSGSALRNTFRGPRVLVDGRKDGLTTLTASAAGVSTTVTLDVRVRTIVLVQVFGVSKNLIAGDVVQAEVAVKDNSAQIVPFPVAWTTSNAAVATVSPAGLITAVGPGAVTITATSAAASGSLQITVAPAVVTPG
jgi:hypothetical protein